MAFASMFPFLTTASSNVPFESPYDYRPSILFVAGQDEDGPHVTAAAAGQYIIIAHSKTHITWTLACRIHDFVLAIRLTKEDALDVADEPNLPATFAEAFSNKCYTEKANHCLHMQPFLLDVKYAASRMDFRTVMLTTMGITSAEAQHTISS